jgi:hypothetical protein
MTRLVLLATLLGGCARERACKSGTLLVGVAFDAATANTNSLEVTTTVEGVGSAGQTLPHTRGVNLGTIEVVFNSGYPTGKLVTVSIVASDNGVPVGSGMGQRRLAAGCDRLSLSLVAGALPDGGVDGFVLRQGLIATMGQPQSAAPYILKDDGFELGARSCVGALCCSGGITP